MIVGTIIGLILLCIGVGLAGFSSYARYWSSIEWQYTTQGRPGGTWHYRSYKVQFLSLLAFVGGTVVVSFGGIWQLFGWGAAFLSLVAIFSAVYCLYRYVRSPVTWPVRIRAPWQTTATFLSFRRKNGDLPYVLSLNVRVTLPNDDPVRTVGGVLTCWVKKDEKGGRTTVYQENLDITAAPRFEKPQWLARLQWFNKPRHFKRVVSHVLRLDFDNFSNSHRILRDELERTTWDFVPVRIVYLDEKEERFRKDPVTELQSEN